MEPHTEPSADEPRRRPEAEQRIISLLVTLLIANPAILFLATGSVLLSISITLLAVVAAQILVFAFTSRLLAAYAFNIAAVLSLFVHAEIIFIYGFPKHVVENLYTIEDGYYFNQPFLEQVFSAQEYSVRYRTNAQGFRIGDDQDPSHVYTSVDWLVIGDSFTQGAQVDFPSLYTSLLGQRFPERIVVNAGISGLGLGHEYNYYLDAGHRLSPNLVILQLCSFNDFTNVEPHSVGLSDTLMAHSAFIRFLLADFKFTNSASLPLGRWTEPFHPDIESNRDFNVFYRETSAKKERDLRLFREYLRKFREAVEQRGAQLLVVLIPTKEQVHARYLEEVVESFSLGRDQLDMRRPNTLLTEIARDLHLDVLDLLPAFQAANADPFLQYDEHLSPAGHQQMAAAIGDWVADKYGASQVRVVSREPGAARYPMPSEDGQWISYQSFRDGNSELFLATSDMSHVRRLTFNDVDESHPMLSRDASQILFTEGDAASQETNVAVMNIDGSGRRHITADPRVFGAIPVFSPSYASIAYAEWIFRPEDNEFTPARIVLLDLISGAKRYITSADRESWRPVFSPDGRQLFYISKADGRQYDLYSRDLDTDVEHQLTRTPYDEWDPQVSRDGQYVIHAARADGNWDLFALDLALGTTLRVTRTKGDEWDPVFSIDGDSVLYAGRFGLIEALFETAWPSK